ncbi:copper resistance D family protein [Candidatus Binatus sp.]|uniref:copper resistance D family protein n=1 Tax=Candidatus Binatus sp. TaxID=2811406 RepID=UPI003C677964
MIPQPIFAWPLVGSQVLIFGTAAFALVAAPATIGDGDGWNRSMASLWRVLALIVLVMSPLRLLSVAAGMADSTFREVMPMMPQIMRETFAGRVWTWRLATALLLAIVAWIPAPGRLATTLIFAVAAALLGLQSVTSHAVDKGAFAIAVHFAHEAAAGLWIGALVSLLIGATYGYAGAEWLRAATPRVSKIAGWSVAALVVTGAIRAWDALGLHLDLLVNSIYGRTLLWKVGTAATVILIGGYNRYRLVGSVGESSARASLIRNVAVECVLLAIVIGWSVVLANTPPPH